MTVANFLKRTEEGVTFGERGVGVGVCRTGSHWHRQLTVPQSENKKHGLC